MRKNRRNNRRNLCATHRHRHAVAVSFMESSFIRFHQEKNQSSCQVRARWRWSLVEQGSHGVEGCENEIMTD